MNGVQQTPPTAQDDRWTHEHARKGRSHKEPLQPTPPVTAKDGYVRILKTINNNQRRPD